MSATFAGLHDQRQPRVDAVSGSLGLLWCHYEELAMCSWTKEEPTLANVKGVV